MKVAKVDFTWAYLELSLPATSVTGAEDTNIRGASRVCDESSSHVNDNAGKTRDCSWDKAVRWTKNIIYTKIVCGGFQLSKRYTSPCSNDAEFNFHYQFYWPSYLRQIRKYSR